MASRYQQQQLPPHIIAMRYCSGDGEKPTDEECTHLHDSLYYSVQHISSLKNTIATHEAQIRAIAAENESLRAEAAKGIMPANVEIVNLSEKELVGHASPCGQIMSIIMPNGVKIFVKCIIAGVPAFDGRCPIHAAGSVAMTPSPPTPVTQPKSFAAVTAGSDSSK